MTASPGEHGRYSFSALFLVRPARDPMLSLAVWTGAAALSVLLACVRAFQPGSLEDLWLVRDWVMFWVLNGNPYESFTALDYPPNAFLVLWPLSLIDRNATPWLVVPSIILASVAAAWILVGWVADKLDISLRWADRVTLVAMLAADSTVRGAIWRGQSTPLAFLFGALALHWGRRRPALAAVALALCAFKPHIALGFALTLLLTQQGKVVWMAAALTFVQWVIFGVTVDRSVLQLIVNYAQQLMSTYGGPDRVEGMLSVRWIIEDLAGRLDVGAYLYVALAIVALGTIVMLARRAAMPAHIAAACLLWSLMFLPQQLYNGMFAVPALWLLMWPEARAIDRSSWRATVVAACVLFGVLDVPRLLRVIAAVNDAEPLATLSYYLNPLYIVMLFGLVMRAWSGHLGDGARAGPT